MSKKYRLCPSLHKNSRIQPHTNLYQLAICHLNKIHQCGACLSRDPTHGRFFITYEYCSILLNSYKMPNSPQSVKIELSLVLEVSYLKEKLKELA